MTHPNIVLIGHVCIDHNTSEHATYDGWGSSVLYMAEYYRQHTGASPTVISSYGPDMLEYLPPVHMLPSQPDQPDTLVYENDTSTGKRTQKCHNAPSAVSPAMTAETIEAVKQADIIVIATLLPNYTPEYLEQVMAYAKPETLKVLCPQGYFRTITSENKVTPREFTEAPAILPLFDLVMYSEEDYPDAFVLAEQWKQTAKAKVIVTQSADGASIVEKGTIIQVPTLPIPLEEIVDSVGCGDTFAAAVTLSYYKTRDLHAAIQDGHRKAAQKLKAVITIK